MTQSYRSYSSNKAAAPMNFEGKVRAALGRKVQRGIEGIDLNAEKKNASPFIVHRNFRMEEDVIRLGIDVAAKVSYLEPLVWVHWMTDAEVINSSQGVRVLHRSIFFCEQAEKSVGPALTTYFGKPVRFEPHPAIADRVEA